MKNIYTVAQVNAYIRNMFTQDFMLRSLYVRGEVGNCKYHQSGHLYFTLKDEKGAISCVMFAGNRGGLKFRLSEGQQVIVCGGVDVYERDGRYQLYAKEILPDGTGELYLRFEQLKRELEERGLFAQEYKQPLPFYIRTLGVVTAPTGAAVQDIINITKRRNPYVQILLYPAIVQGEQAPQSIVNGIRALEAAGVDAMIVGRGGGSLEDLWGFNEECVAQAVFDCSVPVISAVGHETDTTIVDYVADLRAPTPSAAAELAVCEVSKVEERLNAYQRRLDRGLRTSLEAQRGRLEVYRLRLAHASPASRIKEKRMQALRTEERLEEAMDRLLQNCRGRLLLYTEKLKGLSPLDKLSQGFSYAEGVSGRPVTRIGQVMPGDSLRLYVKDGVILTKVTGTEQERPREEKGGE